VELRGIKGECRSPQGFGCRILHVPDVRARHLGQGLEGAEGSTEVRCPKPGPELSHRTEAGEHVVALEGRVDIGRDRDRAQPAPLAAGEVQVALQLHVASGCLLRVALANPVVDEVVELVQ